MTYDEWKLATPPWYDYPDEDEPDEEPEEDEE